MSNQITAYPYKRIKTSACLWEDYEIIYPTDCSFEDISEKWDYDVDLELKVAVELSELALAPEQREGLDGIRLVIDAHCPSTMWRDYEVDGAEIVVDAGTRKYSASIQIPGHLVSELLEVRTYLVGPIVVPFFGKEISQVILAEGPSKTIFLENSLAYFPTSILSFSEANWVDAPWRFELSPGTLDDLYINCSRLYINSDKEISEILSNSEGDALNINAITAIMRDVLLVTLMKLTSDRALREECREADFASGTVGQVVSRQFRDLFGRSLDAVISEFEKNPLPIMMELDAGSNYFGKAI